MLSKLQPCVSSHLVGGCFSSQEASSPPVQLFRENSRSSTAYSEGIKPCGVHRSSQLLWVCLDHELVLSDSAQAPCQPQCHPPGGEADLCRSMDHTGSRMDEPAFLLTAGEPGNCILPLALGAAEVAGGSAAPAGLGEIAIQVWHRQVRLQHLVSCLHESRVGVWELVGHLGSHRMGAPVPGAFLWVGGPGESS